MSGAGQPSIADYALLSDWQGSALVSRGGSIDWACLPRFDAPATFARLLHPAAGHWSLAPQEPAEPERAYLPDTMVLRTRLRTASGVVAVTDALPFMPLERGMASASVPPTPSSAWSRAWRGRSRWRRR